MTADSYPQFSRQQGRSFLAPAPLVPSLLASLSASPPLHWKVVQKCSIQYNSKIQSMLSQVQRFSSFVNNINRIMMKKNFTVALLVLALTSTSLATSIACNCACDDYDGSCPLPVNQPIVIATPPTIQPPACAIPCIKPPVLTPPPVNIPTIDPPCIHVPTLTPPPVIAPPVIVPPTPVIPTACPLPSYTPPSLPPQVPPPGVLPTLPAPPVITLPPRPPRNCNPGALSNQFTLTFTYACRPNVAFQSCLGEVLWNNVIIASIVPTNYQFQTVSFTVFAQVGQNSLQFAGAGRSDSFGLLIDDVSLVRSGTSQNIVINGDFSVPNVGSWGIFNDISGWKGVGIEIGKRIAYGLTGNNQLAELDGHRNYQITQYFTFNTQFVQLSNVVAACTNPFGSRPLNYTLSFSWAVRTVGCVGTDTSKGNVFWNNEIVAVLTLDGSATTGINHVSVPVELKAGENVLQFDGTSFSDSFGVSIDNVKLFSAYNSTNLIVNGDFSSPSVAPGFSYINGGILGWQAVKAEVGGCRNYNLAWPAGQQCLELDSDSNQRYTQVINISNQLYSQLWLYIQQVVGNGQVIASTNLAINNGHVVIGTQLANINSAVHTQIAMICGQFNHYINQLYNCTNAAIQNVQANQLVTITQYACASSQWLQYFGSSGELDFECDNYCENDYVTGFCVIIKIKGKIITCNGPKGTYHLQLAPCSHFEGTHPSGLPQYGEKIFWKGTQSSCGRIYVKVATTCNC